MHFLIYFLPRVYAHLPKNNQPPHPPRNESPLPPKKKYLKCIDPWVYFWGFMVCRYVWMDAYDLLQFCCEDFFENLHDE